MNSFRIRAYGGHRGLVKPDKDVFQNVSHANMQFHTTHLNKNIIMHQVHSFRLASGYKMTVIDSQNSYTYSFFNNLVVRICVGVCFYTQYNLCLITRAWGLDTMYLIHHQQHSSSVRQQMLAKIKMCVKYWCLFFNVYQIHDTKSTTVPIRLFIYTSKRMCILHKYEILNIFTNQYISFIIHLCVMFSFCIYPDATCILFRSIPLLLLSCNSFLDQLDKWSQISSDYGRRFFFSTKHENPSLSRFLNIPNKNFRGHKGGWGKKRSSKGGKYLRFVECTAGKHCSRSQMS